MVNLSPCPALRLKFRFCLLTVKFHLKSKHAKLNIIVTVTTTLPAYATDVHEQCTITSHHEMDLV